MFQTNRKRRYRRHCFSLIEIMIVVAIIGLLSGIVGVNVLRKMDKARKNAARAEISTLKDCVGMYYADMGEFPRTLEDLVRNPGGSNKWDGPYPNKDTIPKDPWGSDYVYQCPGQHGDFDIYSVGKDRSPSDDDITSWGE